MNNECLRLLSLIGEDSLAKLKNSHIAVFGLGGVGSYATEALARSFVGEITLIDFDVFESSNINRQLCALKSTVGERKTEITKKRIYDINPDCKVNIIDEFYSPEKKELFFSNKKYDYVIDAIDNITAKIDIICFCYNNGISLVSCMGTGNKIKPEMLKIDDIFSTSVCPLCKVVRHELRKTNVNALDVIYSEEEIKGSLGRTPSSSAFVPATAGILAAAHVFQKIII